MMKLTKHLIPTFENDYVRVAAACATVRVADPFYNIDSIIKIIKEIKDNPDIILFPELSVSGYTCADLFLQQSLMISVNEALQRLMEFSVRCPSMIVVGAPYYYQNRLYNCAIVIYQGETVGIVPKTNIPNYGEFYERRWFYPAPDRTESATILGKDVPFGTNLLFQTPRGNAFFGIEICEDLWVPSPVSNRLAAMGADLILNLSATDENIGKHRYLLDLIRQQSARLRCGYAYASAGIGESSTDLVFSGNTVIAEDGKILRNGPRFSRKSSYVISDIDVANLRRDRMVFNTYHSGVSVQNAFRVESTKSQIIPQRTDIIRNFDPHPFVPSDKTHLDENCEEIIAIQSWGLEQRLLSTGCKHLVVGISGGLDSTLALIVACNAFDRLGLPRNGIIGVTMPGEATSDRTHNNASKLMEELGVDSREIPIGKAVAQHFKDIDQNPDTHDAAYENSQARERTQILMDLANKENGMVLGTGDLSELALGWCTYNGDQMSMYGVNASVPKTLVKHLVDWYARNKVDEATRATLIDIVETPISPELIPCAEEAIGQKTEELVGPYELHDFFLYHTLRHGRTPTRIFTLALLAFNEMYEPSFIKKWLVSFYRRFFSQQFKRSCMPDGPKTGSVCLSPRGDWRMPSDACASVWLREAEALPESI
ncbi:MAG: NAD(+) synthase [Muribaculum sp.]|nr:NAD(+) synthase [Muribaculum sp.]